MIRIQLKFENRCFNGTNSHSKRWGPTLLVSSDRRWLVVSYGLQRVSNAMLWFKSSCRLYWFEPTVLAPQKLSESTLLVQHTGSPLQLCDPCTFDKHVTHVFMVAPTTPTQSCVRKPGVLGRPSSSSLIVVNENILSIWLFDLWNCLLSACKCPSYPGDTMRDLICSKTLNKARNHSL